MFGPLLHWRNTPQEDLSVYSALHQQFMRGNADVRLYFLMNEVKYALDDEIKLKILNILQILSLQPQISFTFMESIAQALCNIQDLEALDRLQEEALQSKNEDDVRQWLGEFLPSKELEIRRKDAINDDLMSRVDSKIDSILKILHTRFELPYAFLQFTARALRDVAYIKILEHLEEAFLDSKSKADVLAWLDEYLPEYGAADKITGTMRSKIDSIIKILRRLEISPALLELAEQALGRIYNVEVLYRLEDAALYSKNEQDVHKWLDEYLSQNESETE